MLVRVRRERDFRRRGFAVGVDVDARVRAVEFDQQAGRKQRERRQQRRIGRRRCTRVQPSRGGATNRRTACG